MTRKTKLRFILVNVVPPVFNRQAANYDLEELKSLVQTFGGADIIRIVQRRNFPDSSTYLGSGKAQEVAEMIRREKIDAVVLNTISTPEILFRLKKVFWPANNDIQVWDRVDLILQIFSRHARSAEAKLQIELASMRHMGPRIYGLGGRELSRQGGGIGTRGLGETNIELMKRHWRNRMKKVKDELGKLEKNRQRIIDQRRNSGLFSVSIVGYTNAGKTTLFNALTGKNKQAENVLFATLDSVSGRLKGADKIILSDTIGFISNLPPQLIDAFRSTLAESINADLLLHVIDAGDVKLTDKVETVEKILGDIGAGDKQRIYIFNKMDAANGVFRKEEMRQLYGRFNPLFVSALNNEGLMSLVEIISGLLK